MKPLLLGCLAALIIAGCATAPPQTRVEPIQDELGRIKVTADSEQAHSFFIGLDKRLYITDVDQKSTNTACITWPSCYAQEVFVGPGRHYLNLRFAHLNSYASGTVWFDAEAGKSYVVRKKLSGYGVQFWVEEASTGRPVGGRPGAEEEKK